MKDELASTIMEIEAHKDDLIEFCQHMVRLPSLSGEEREVAQVIIQKMKELGFSEVSTDELGSVLGTLKGGKGHSLLFNGHMDNVPAGSLENWSVDPFGATIKVVGGHRAIFGRGSVDMKGALAAQVFAVGMLCQLGITPPGDLHVAAVVH
ncbi:MAG: M20/M25/M40 family metallo-hydrolase, partial [Candidatus Heimdallarchaeota archaeon]